MKDLKYDHQSTFPLWGRVKLNYRDRYRKPNIYSKNSSHYQVFSLNSQKLTLWCKKLLPIQMDLHDPYMFMGWVVVGGVIRLSFQSNSNSQKLSLWCCKGMEVVTPGSPSVVVCSENY